MAHRPSREAAWAHLRFSIVGPLLSSPPRRGELKTAFELLASKTWQHPISGATLRFSSSTIERWYYKALRARQDPVGVLRRQTRKDVGQHVAFGEKLKRKLLEQYEAFDHWSYRLHHDNLRELVTADPSLGRLPSYPSLVRFMRARNLLRRPRPRNAESAGLRRARARLKSREVRSYEVEHVNALWHLDFHHSSLKVLDSRGEWVRPIVLGVLDDRSRLACHVQWYLSETTEDLVHGLSQAILKRGLPRALMSDNGAAMLAEEFTQGLFTLGITHETTLPYSPYQNGKQESFWGRLEGRLMAMLESCPELDLAFLNRATQAWVEREYNRAKHGEIGETPLERFARGPDVNRPSPSPQSIRHAFRQRATRTQRRSDGTVSLEGLRLEIPGRFRHLERVTLAYARWDMRTVHLVDERNGTLLAPIYPLDRARNADAKRRKLESETTAPTSQESPDLPSQGAIPPLLDRLLRDYAVADQPPAYFPRDESERKEGE